MLPKRRATTDVRSSENQVWRFCWYMLKCFSLRVSCYQMLPFFLQDAQPPVGYPMLPVRTIDNNSNTVMYIVSFTVCIYIYTSGSSSFSLQTLLVPFFPELQGVAVHLSRCSGQPGSSIARQGPFQGLVAFAHVPHEQHAFLVL